jgi:ribosomal protein S19
MKKYENQTHKHNFIIDRSLVWKQENSKGFKDTQNVNTNCRIIYLLPEKVKVSFS